MKIIAEQGKRIVQQKVFLCIIVDWIQQTVQWKATLGQPKCWNFAARGSSGESNAVSQCENLWAKTCREYD